MIYDKLTPLEYLEFVAGLWNVDPSVAQARAVGCTRSQHVIERAIFEHEQDYVLDLNIWRIRWHFTDSLLHPSHITIPQKTGFPCHWAERF